MTDRTDGESAFHVAGIASIRFPRPPTRKSYRSKSTLRARRLNRSSRIGLEDRHDLPTRDNSHPETRRKIIRQWMALPKDKRVVFHVCSTLGRNFSTRPEATASFTASRNSSGLVVKARIFLLSIAGSSLGRKPCLRF
jgi:hypothetical protein